MIEILAFVVICILSPVFGAIIAATVIIGCGLLWMVGMIREQYDLMKTQDIK